jgi:hypothetical protein
MSGNFDMSELSTDNTIKIKVNFEKFNQFRIKADKEFFENLYKVDEDVVNHLLSVFKDINDYEDMFYK